MYLKQLLLHGYKRKSLIVFIAIFLISLAGFYRTNTNRIVEIKNLMENSLHNFIHSNAEGVSTGFFKWDEMYVAISSNDIDFLKHYEHDITTSFAFTGDMSLIDKPFDGTSDYSIYTSNGNAYIEFGIFDSDHNKFLTDQVIRLSFNPQTIFDQTLNNSKFKFNIQIENSDSIDGIHVLNTENSLLYYHYISALSIALLSMLLIQTFYRLSVSSYYEIDGLDSIVMLLSKKDTYTAEHSKEVATIAVIIASRLGYTKKQQKILYKAGQLHDIGKIGISESLLNKSGKLLPEEYDEIKKHSIIGYEIVSQFPNLNEVAIIVKHHHEMLDGSGYPDGLKGSEIPFNSQILNVADVYNALTTDRPYRKGFDRNQAFEIMVQMPLNQKLVALLKAYFLGGN